MLKKAALVGLVCLAPGLVPAAAEEEPATHIVRPGDTLRGLTRQHLGTELRWRENWSLNPWLEDPGALTPGQRIRILVPRLDPPVPTARVVLVNGDVEERPAPVDWLGALSDDLLLERDGLRTGANSSSALVFPDGTRLALTEGSLVFMRRAGRSLEGVDERSVEILEGQAELAATESAGPVADIEIVIGSAVAKPQSGAGGELQARARKSESGGAAVMMYEGSGAVEAAGETVAVDRGMGTAVPESGPPAPPEKLLPAPSPRAPEAGARLPFPDPELAWSEVEGAASYVLELCADRECLELFRRFAGFTATAWRAPPLPVAEHHWRVTAVSPSGLDGYPSATARFTVLSDRRDVDPPTATFELEGPTAESGGGLFYAPSAEVRVEVRDEPAGVASWTPRIDGRPGAVADLAGPWSDGPHRVDVEASDRLGNAGTHSGPRFTVDAEPPRLIWEVGADQALGELLARVEKPERWQRRWRFWQRRARRSLARRDADPALWALVAWNTDAFSRMAAEWSARPLRWRERRRHQTVSHAGGAPAMLIVAPRLVVPGAGEPLGERMVLVGAADDKAGVRTLSLRTVAGPSGPRLEIETVDRLGNRRLERVEFWSGE